MHDFNLSEITAYAHTANNEVKRTVKYKTHAVMIIL